jgi:glycosyltransferase involved in cell wall biosynthesis
VNKFEGKNFVNPGNVKIDDPKAAIAIEAQILSDLIIDRKQTGHESLGDKDALIQVAHDVDWVTLRIAKRLIKEAGPRKAIALAQLASGNLFTPHNEIRTIERKPGKSCAFFSDGRSFYTGGRYSVFMHAVLLAEVMNVTWLTDEPLPFESDFPDHKVKVIEDARIFERKMEDLGVDFVVGLPNLSGQAAAAYSEQFKIPYYLVMFESPNFIKEFRSDGEDAKETYWTDYKKCMRGCDAVIAHSNVSADFTRDWLSDGEGRLPPVRVTHPTWNKTILDAELFSQLKPREGVVICSRSAPFKDPYALLVELDKIGFKERVVIIGKTWKTDRYEKDWSFELILYGTISDTRKFSYLKQAKVLAMPSQFEGFGMPPMEALACGTPVIAYDLPVLKSIYEGEIVYTPIGNAGLMARRIVEACDPEIRDIPFQSKPILKKLSPRSALTSLKRAFPGPLTLGVGIIAYDIGDWVGKAIENAAQYADEVYIVHGRCADFPEAPHGDQHTIEEIEHAISQIDVPVFFHRLGEHIPPTKVALQNFIAERVETDIYMKQDADEFWHPEDVQKALEMFVEDEELDIIRVSWHHFWKNLKQVTCDAGGQWTNKHPRFWRWNSGFSHTFTHNNFVDADGIEVRPPDYPEVVTDLTCYHCGYARGEEYVQRKIEFYRDRGIEKDVKDTYTDWKPGDRTQPTQHANVNSWVEPFKGKLPEILK